MTSNCHKELVLSQTDTISIHLEDESAGLVFASDLAHALRAGDVVALHGDLGSGKTTIARQIIRTLFKDDLLEVPSPTFAIQQTYGEDDNSPSRQTVHHLDLYRLQDESELAELGFLENLQTSIVLIEWPQLALHLLPETCCHLRLQEDAAGEGRIATIEVSGKLAERLQKSLQIRDFLNTSWAQGVRRVSFPADASQRSYEHVFSGDEHRILMNAPRLPDGPPIRNGKPYSQIAHLAEDTKPFIAIAKSLAEHGLAAPEIYAYREEEGLVLLEYLGKETIITDDRQPIEERYLASMEALVKLHSSNWTASGTRNIDVDGKFRHSIPSYSRDAMMIEVELLPDWYIPAYGHAEPDKAQRDDFIRIWDDLIAQLEHAEQSLVLRDFHSPNIIWRGQEQGTGRIGLIDFQDAMIGPAAYDVASIGQDARVDIPRELEEKMIQCYIDGRNSANAGFDEAAFRRAYAIMAAQRVTKILGIFVRLDRRDGKSAYLAHLPRMQDYLSRNLEHEVLEPYRNWLADILPESLSPANHAGQLKSRVS